MFFTLYLNNLDRYTIFFELLSDYYLKNLKKIDVFRDLVLVFIKSSKKTIKLTNLIKDIGVFYEFNYLIFLNVKIY